ncbi:MAG: hypothetical protein KAW09_08215, partial [Thermoplasmata archaeon]|nr:hypothetical protein [Thermoplasmata archaeon]
VLLLWVSNLPKLSAHTIALSLIIPGLLIFVSAFTSHSAAATDWGSIVLITDDEANDDYSYNPQIASDKFGNIHVVWDDRSDLDDGGANYDVFYKKWDALTGTWGERRLLSAKNDNSSTAPRIASDSNGNIHVVWRDNNFSAKFPYDSTVKHGIWNVNTKQWEIHDFDINEITAEFRVLSITADAKSNIHLVTDGGHGEQQLYYTFWDGASRTWSSPSEILNRFNGAHRPDIAVDSIGNVHVVYDDIVDENGQIADFDIWYTRMDKTTGQWDTPKQMNDDGSDFSNAYTPSIAIDRFDNVHVVWNDHNWTYSATGQDTEIFFRRYDASGGAWSEMTVVSDDHANNTKPSCGEVVAVDSAGNAHIIWTDLSDLDKTGDERYDVFYRMWNASTETFDDRVPVTDPHGDMYSSATGHIEVDPEDNLHVAWHGGADNIQHGQDVDIFYLRTKTDEIPLGKADLEMELKNVGDIPQIMTDSDRARMLEHFEHYLPHGRDFGSGMPIDETTRDVMSPSRIRTDVDMVDLLGMRTAPFVTRK